MTALYLDAESASGAGQDLHAWLNGAWALLFSHPEDFHDRAADRQRRLGALQQEFRVRAVRALAVRRDAQSAQPTWLDDLVAEPQQVRLREPSFAASDPVSFAARALRGELLTLQPRFVLIVDATLKRRELFKYSAGRTHVSALDLLAGVDALRRRHPISRAA